MIYVWLRYNEVQHYVSTDPGGLNFHLFQRGFCTTNFTQQPNQKTILSLVSQTGCDGAAFQWANLSCLAAMQQQQASVSYIQKKKPKKNFLGHSCCLQHILILFKIRKTSNTWNNKSFMNSQKSCGWKGPLKVIWPNPKFIQMNVHIFE